MQDPSKRSIAVLITLCVFILMICAVYFLAEYRAGSKRQNVALNRPQMMMPREPLEGGGVEGIMTQRGLMVTATGRRAQSWGLQVGDVVQSAGGQQIFHPAQLGQLAPGATIQAERAGRPFQTTNPAIPQQQPFAEQQPFATA